MTQLITGHECFGDYLCRIGKKPSNKCLHCGGIKGGREGAVDIANHILEVSSSWTIQRNKLSEVMDQDLTISILIHSIINDEEKWKTVYQFCEEVMRSKEEKEREREIMGERARAGNRRRR